ncbi:MAG: hypothetical protein WB709_03785 [Solirubrobacteraceae bacterium]
MSSFLKRPQVILSLCDGSGAWSEPYVDADYDVRCYDLARGDDVRLLQCLRPVHGILAAPPCTMFAKSGNRWLRSDDDLRDGLAVVDACLRIVFACQPKWWCLENPPGKLTRYLGPPCLTFQPNEYGDDYTKQTNLWGVFTPPARSPVPALAGSKMHVIPDSSDQAARRSVTPSHFARAFFEANP